MALSGITIQPTSGSPVAAYRPIVITAAPSGSPVTDNPVAYCDIYFNGIFYKTLSKSQTADVLGTQEYVFDIQDAAQEFLSYFIGPNGGGAILTAMPLVAECFVKVRGSVYDTEGFIVPDAAIPIQGTALTAPVAGGGSQSNTFYVVNSTLQHDQNQVFTEHLNEYKLRGTWGATTFPLTHRPEGYKLCPGDSDYFPILSDIQPTGIRIHYTTKGGDSTDGEPIENCVGVSGLSGYTLPNAIAGEFYSVSIPLFGTGPFTLDTSSGPGWMAFSIVDSALHLEGNPTDGDEGTGISITATVSNCEGANTADLDDLIDVIVCDGVTLPATNMPDARAGEPYFFAVALGGDGPFINDGSSLPAWMTATIVGATLQFTGTPTADDVATGVAISIDICNCGGSHCANYSDTIDVLPSNNFIANAAFNFRIDNITGTNTPSPTIFPTALNGQKKGHQTGLSGSYTVTVTGTIVTNTKMTAYVNGSPVDCWQMGSTIGTVFTAVTHGFTVTATEDDNVIFSIEQGNC